MFENLPPRNRPTDASGSPRQRALGALGATLGTLPAPWRVLRDVGAAADGSSLGASFIALHPRHGIALIDLAPSRPRAAVGPLRMLLSRTGNPIFTAREPPIVPILLSREEIPQAVARVDQAFGELSPCFIRDPSWPRLAIAAIAAESLLLSPIEQGGGTDPLVEPRLARPAPDARPRREPVAPPHRRDAMRPLRIDPAPPLEGEPAPRRAREEFPTSKREPRLHRLKETASPRPSDREPDERIEPTLSRKPASTSATRLSTPSLAMEPEDAWDDEPPHRARRRGNLRQSLLWVVAASLAVVAGIVFVHPRQAVQSIAPSPPSQLSAPQAQLDTGQMPAGSTTSSGSTLAETTTPDRPAKPAAAVVTPPRAATVLPPVAAKRETAQADRVEPRTLEKKPREASAETQRAAPIAQRRAQAKAGPEKLGPDKSAAKEIASAKHAPEATTSAKSTREPIAKPAAKAQAVATREKRETPPHTPALAEVKPEVPPRAVAKPGRTAPERMSAVRHIAPIPTPRMVPGSNLSTTARTQPAQPADRDTAATVTVDGMHYVQGREPHKLGTLGEQTQVADTPSSVEHSDKQAKSAPAAVPPPSPSTQFSITPSGILSPSGRFTPFGQH